MKRANEGAASARPSPIKKAASPLGEARPSPAPLPAPAASPLAAAAGPAALPMDRSALIPREVLPAGSKESMIEFAIRNAAGLAASGLARCSVPVPALAGVAGDSAASLKLLESALGKSFRVHCYACACEGGLSAALCTRSRFAPSPHGAGPARRPGFP